jgi:uncharacterized protein (DUF433 family)
VPEMANYATAKRIKYPYIVWKKGVRRGVPAIEGTGNQVMDIGVRYHLLENSPDEVLAAYPDLTLSQIYDALSYYHDHKEEMDKEWKDSLEKVDEIKKGHKSILEKKLKSLEL